MTYPWFSKISLQEWKTSPIIRWRTEYQTLCAYCRFYEYTAQSDDVPILIRILLWIFKISSKLINSNSVNVNRCERHFLNNAGCLRRSLSIFYYFFFSVCKQLLKSKLGRARGGLRWWKVITLSCAVNKIDCRVFASWKVGKHMIISIRQKFQTLLEIFSFLSFYKEMQDFSQVYLCKFVHLQSIQVYTNRYRIPRYWCTQHQHCSHVIPRYTHWHLKMFLYLNCQ